MLALDVARLEDVAWPISRLGELLENMGRRSGLLTRPFKLSQPPNSLSNADDMAIGAWLDNASNQLGLEVEPVTCLYAEVPTFIEVSPPAILRLPGELRGNQPRFVGLLRGGKGRVTILTPDLRNRSLRTVWLRKALCYPYEGYIGQSVEQLLRDARVPEERMDRARQAILNEQLGPLRIEGGWLLRLPPAASLPAQFAHGGIYKPVAVMLGMYLVQQILAIASWYLIGRGIFQGHFDTGWLFAWAILLFSTIPVQIIVNDAQSELAMNSGAIFKQRLIYGALKLEPEEIRHQGIGQFLGRVLESDAVEMLAFSGGFMAVLSIIEFVLALIILFYGAGGALSATILGVWIIITLYLLYRYYQASREWVETYRGMTNDLVERMVGHRTRLIQENPAHWHDDEDQTLDRYLKLSENLDSIGLTINAFVTRGWLVMGLASLSIPFIAGGPAPQAIAIGLGGVLLASQALGKLTSGAQSLVSLFNAWQQVRPLFHAASRKRETASLDIIPGASISAHDVPGVDSVAGGYAPALLIARDLVFRYRPLAKPVVKEASIAIYPGDRILLEGPSGGGKSTLASILTGLRRVESGSLLLWGYDQHILGVDEWRRRIVMAPQFQENHVFSETFAFNLLMGRRWPPLPEDLQEAEEICRELNLGDLLDRMPSGFQQTLGESGWQLSHGERSRLFIARTLLQDAELIILDESFGALDPENLALALQCVLRRSRTLMVIAHP